jgi:hypothetical protein
MMMSGYAISLSIDGETREGLSLEVATELVRVRVVEPFRLDRRSYQAAGLKLGAVLNSIKHQVEHGAFAAMLHRLELNAKTAQRWMRKARGGVNPHPPHPPHPPQSAEKRQSVVFQPEQGAESATYRGELSEDERAVLFDDALAALEGDGGDELEDAWAGDEFEDEGEELSPESGCGRDAAPALGMSPMVAAAWAGLKDASPAEDLRRVVQQATAPSPVVQLTLAGEYERIEQRRRELVQRMDLVMVAVRGGVMPAAACQEIAGVLEHAGHEIERIAHECGPRGGPAIPPAPAG